MSDPMKIRATVRNGTTDVRILMMHPMETGLRRDAEGRQVPALFITQVLVEHNGRVVFKTQWGTSVAKNPVLGLRLRDAKVGDQIRVNWVDNTGDQRSDSVLVAAA